MPNNLLNARSPRRRALALGACLVSLAACGAEPPAAVAPDASPDVEIASPDVADVPVAEERAPDAEPDVAPDVTEAPDVAPPVVNPCAASAIVDVNRVGTHTAHRFVYRGTTASGPPTETVPHLANCPIAGRAIRTVVHRFTTTAAVYVRATTISANSAGHDTILWFARNCSLTAPAAVICNDDAIASGQSTLYLTQAPPGATIYLGVATVAEHDGAPGLPYELTVEEFPTAAAGEACLPSNFLACAAGNTCVRGPDDGAGVCRAEASVPGARCRATAPTCDDGLTCVGTTCMAQGAVGERCTLGETYCGVGVRCVNSDTATPRQGVCTAGGGPGGFCNATTACDDGLQCSLPAPTGTATGTCQRHVAAGRSCNPAGTSIVCDAPLECAPDPMSSGHFRCAEPGLVAGARCRPDGSCNEGLRCNAAGGLGYCRAPATDACAPTTAASECGVGRACAASSGVQGRCVAWVRESTDDNSAIYHAEAPRALPTVIRGALLPAGDVDCFSVELAHEGPLVFRVHDGTGRCLTGAQPTVQLAPADALESFLTLPGCAFAGGTTGYRYPAGRYVACVTPPGSTPVLDYFLSLNAP